MTYQEARQALKTRAPVKVNGTEYKHINAIIFRKTDKIELIQVELQDMNNNNSVTIARLEQVECI